MTTPDAVEAVWRIESGQLIASLTRLSRDLGTAEELAQDALVAALERWPHTGIPENPGGWLMTTAKNAAVDRARRERTYQRKLESLGRELEGQQHTAPDEVESALADPIGDDLLRLIFMSCHPVLSTESKVALTLRCLGGLTTEQIARAFLITNRTAAQRIVRAKRTLGNRAVEFELPGADEMAPRLSAVLAVIYLIFNEGYAASDGAELTRPRLCEEALRLARILAARMPGTAEVHGFVALLELQAARLPARTASDGSPILLLEQDRSQWDRLLIRRGIDALSTAETLANNEGSDARTTALGPHTLQVAIAACHARAATAAETDWHRITALYELLRYARPSPVVELNRAIAVGMTHGPAAGLEALDSVAEAPELREYPYLPATRADLLDKLGYHDSARAEYERAAAITHNERERELFRGKARR